MILIISDNDQIIGADEEFLDGMSLDSLRENFPSLSIFTLQSSDDIFEFEYNKKNYSITKSPIIINNQNANIYLFNTNTKSNEIESTPITTPSIHLNTEEKETKEVSDTTHNLDLSLNTNNNNENNFEEENSLNNNELELSLGLDNLSDDKNNKQTSDFNLALDSDDSNENNNELELSLGLDNLSDDKNNEQTSDLNLGLDSIDNSINESDNSLDLGLDSTDNSVNESDNSLDLGLDSIDNSVNESDNSLDLGLDSIDNSVNESDNSLDLGLDSTDNSVNDKFSITEEEIQHDLEQASKDLGIDNTMLQEFFNDFKEQLKAEKPIFEEAINNKNYEQLHKSAHKLKGVALNLRLEKFGELLRQTDELSKNQSDIKEITNILDNIYDAIESNNSKLTFNTDISEEEKNILLKSLLLFLDDVEKKADPKAELLKAYNFVPIQELKDIESIDEENLSKFIKNLYKKVKKEIK